MERSSFFFGLGGGGRFFRSPSGKIMYKSTFSMLFLRPEALIAAVDVSLPEITQLRQTDLRGLVGLAECSQLQGDVKAREAMTSLGTTIDLYEDGKT